jgi:hypothetical protein
MDIQAKLKELLAYKNAKAIVQAAQTSGNVTASDANVEGALESLGEALKRNKHQEAVATILALLLWNADRAVARIRRKGLLRASRYDYRSGALLKAVEAALSLVPRFTLGPHHITYLRSVSVLLGVTNEAFQLRKSLVLRLKSRKKIVQKTLLFLVNEAFANDWCGNPSVDTNKLEHWSAEDLSLAVSYILHLMRKEVGTEQKLWQHVDEHLGKPFESIYANLLIDAAHLNELLEIESLIDGMPYEVVAKGHVLKVFSSDEMLEKSICLGYIQSNIQQDIRLQKVLDHAQRGGQKALTMANFISKAFQVGMGELVQLRTHPIERLVFTVIENEQFFEPIAADILFVEESVSLLSAGIENFQQESELSLRVSAQLSDIDVIKVQRFFSFIQAVFEEKLQSIEDTLWRSTLRKRSTLPIMHAKILRRQLEFILPAEKVTEVIELLTLAENENFIDLQYKPLIAAGEYFVIAPALLARSNLVRNIVIANNLRKVVLGNEDPMQEMVIQALRNTGFKVRANFNFDIEGKRETDIICWRDGYLFVFECKNSFHPCSAHEIRTSYGHLITAEGQLDIRLRWLKETGNQKRLLNWLSWDVPVTSDIHTGIITANRMFNGFTMGQHPVRQAHELINVIERGQIRISDDQTVSFWRGGQLQALDFVDYLQGGSIIQQQFAHMQPFERRIQIGKIVLSLRNYVFDIEGATKAAQSAINKGGRKL